MYTEVICSRSCPQFPADREPCLLINHLLCCGQFLGTWAGGGWRCPSGEYPVVRLRILMAVSVHPVATSLGALIFEAPELLHISLVGWNETTPAGESLGLIEHPALIFITDGDFPLAAALGPGVFQNQPVAAIRPLGLDLDRFPTPQSERGL